MPNTVPAAATGLPASAPQSDDFIDPALLPDRYGLICEGTCMQPEIPDGSTLMFSKSEPYEAGDIVVLFFRPEAVGPGRLQCALKRIAHKPPPWVKFPYREHPESEIAALVMVETTNPERGYAVRCDKLLAIHKCLGPVPARLTADMTEEEKAEVRYREAPAPRRTRKEVARG